MRQIAILDRDGSKPMDSNKAVYFREKSRQHLELDHMKLMMRVNSVEGGFVE